MANHPLGGRPASGALMSLIFLAGASLALHGQETVETLFRSGSSCLAECRAVAQEDLDRRVAAAGSSRSNPPFDVRSAQELKDAALGFGFEMYTLAAPALRSRGTVGAALEPAGIWRFSVTAGGRTVGLLTLAKVSGRLRVVGVGNGTLAGILESLGRLHLADRTVKLRFFRIPEAHQDFLEVVREGAPPTYERITPPGKAITEAEIRNLLPFG